MEAGRRKSQYPVVLTLSGTSAQTVAFKATVKLSTDIKNNNANKSLDITMNAIAVQGKLFDASGAAINAPTIAQVAGVVETVAGYSA